MAGFEYAPLTASMTAASENGVHLGLLTAYMEVADNFLRMLQQVALGDPLEYFDWLAAFGLGACVVWQGYMHYQSDRLRGGGRAPAAPATNGTAGQQVTEMTANGRDPALLNTGVRSDEYEPSTAQALEKREELVVEVQTANDGLFSGKRKRKLYFFIGLIVVVVATSLFGGAFGGPTGQAYVLATLATAAKTFAWWINQYPQLKGASFFKKWMAGWSIAAVIEYFPLIGAFTLASNNGVHLGLMTAYMEALDNLFRICQQYLLDKPLDWYDLFAAAGMFGFVMYQGGSRYNADN